MWAAGSPAGFCDKEAYGPQLPFDLLYLQRAYRRENVPYCHGPCCPNHGGPNPADPIVFQDGWTEEGRPMWCAVMPGFVNLQENLAGFDGDSFIAVQKLMLAIHTSARAALTQPETPDHG
jgi:hypothetical protein